MILIPAAHLHASVIRVHSVGDTGVERMAHPAPTHEHGKPGDEAGNTVELPAVAEESDAGDAA
jgi:hypothetical protein